MLSERLAEWGKQVLEELDVEGRSDALTPLIGSYVRDEAGKRITGLVNETTRKELADSLAAGVEARETWAELDARVKQVFADATDFRAANISTTEVVRATNWATREAQRVSGVVDKRAWAAVPDDHTRDTHRRLNGQERGLDEPFEVDGMEALYPGDFGIASEDCGCRCGTVAIRNDEEDADKALTDEDLSIAWKAYDARLRPFEDAAEAAIKRGFEQQRDDVLKALTRYQG